jgi:hypothetical protein
MRGERKVVVSQWGSMREKSGGREDEDGLEWYAPL